MKSRATLQTNLLTNTMELNFSWEASRSSSGQGIVLICVSRKFIALCTEVPNLSLS